MNKLLAALHKRQSAYPAFVAGQRFGLAGRQLKALDGFGLDRKIQAAGWNFFFMAAEVKVMFFGAIGAKKVQNALRRILGKVREQDFNCLEVTGIVAKRFLGMPYTMVSAHSRHIQQGCELDDVQRR